MYTYVKITRALLLRSVQFIMCKLHFNKKRSKKDLRMKEERKKLKRMREKKGGNRKRRKGGKKGGTDRN